VKKRRMSVEAACNATGGSESHPATLEAKVLWTDPSLDEKQQAVVAKQKAKHRDRKVQALIDGALIDAEVNPNLEQKAVDEQRAREQRARERLAKANRVTRTTRRKQLNTSIFDGQACFLLPGVDASKLQATLKSIKCRVATDRLQAQLFIADDPVHIGCRAQWVAVMQGAYVVTGQALQNGQGAVLKYKAARNVKRSVFMTDQFKARHPEVTKILKQCCHPIKWKLFETKEDPARPPRHHICCNALIAALCRAQLPVAMLSASRAARHLSITRACPDACHLSYNC